MLHSVAQRGDMSRLTRISRRHIQDVDWPNARARNGDPNCRDR